MSSKIFQKIFKVIYKDRSKSNWGDFEYFDKKWKNRIKRMADLINKEHSYLDLGCGRMWLKEFLPPDSLYHACDYTSRGENTLVCDFNKKEFPAITVDCCFASGVIEYLDDPFWFFEQIYRTSPNCIVSYCPIEIQSDIEFRKSLGWRNHMSRVELLQIIDKHHFTISNELINTDGYDIYKFIH